MVEEEDEVETEEDLEELEGEDDVGIFDEDLEAELEDVLEDDLEEVAQEVSDFFIGDTILSTGSGEASWSKEDLEEVLRNERIEREWKDSEEFVGGDFYNVKTGNFYGADGRKREGFYETGRGDDLYKGKDEGDLYNTGEARLYSGKKNDEGVYDVGRGMKSYDEIASERERKHSVLESMGFEDKGKKDRGRR
ncbi:MAG: hypothetical protein V1889_01995 [archaeon]